MQLHLAVLLKEDDIARINGKLFFLTRIILYFAPKSILMSFSAFYCFGYNYSNTSTSCDCVHYIILCRLSTDLNCFICQLCSRQRTKRVLIIHVTVEVLAKKNCVKY